MESVYRITLDTQAAGSQLSLQCTKGDSGRVIEITLTENGNPFVPPSGAYAVFMAHKADGHIIYNNADIDGDKIIYAITAQTTAAVGVSGCEIRVYDASGAVITSARFDMLIDEPVYDDIQIQSTDEYIALADLVAQILDLIREYGESVKKVNSKLPDETGAVVVNSDNILMGTGNYEDYSEEPITDVVDQLGMRIDAAQNTANSAKTSAEAAVKKVNGQTPDSSGAVLLSAEEIQTQQEEWLYNGSVTGAIDEAYEHAEEAMTTANAARTLAVTAVRSVNSKTPTLGNVELRSNDIMMDDGDTYDWGGFTITEALDFIYNEKGGKIQLVYNGTDLRYVSGAPVTFAALKTLLLSNPAFVFLTYNNWAYLTTYIYEPQGGSQYQYIRFSSTVIGTDSDGAKRAKTSSIIVESTDGVSISHIGHSNIDSENASNRANNMNVINDTLYPTTKAVSDYVNSKLAEIPFAEGVTFGG